MSGQVTDVQHCLILIGLLGKLLSNQAGLVGAADLESLNGHKASLSFSAFKTGRKKPLRLVEEIIHISYKIEEKCRAIER